MKTRIILYSIQAAILLLFLHPGNLSAQTSATEIVVKSRTGLVKGILSENCFKFSGIPYAMPPVGDLRWKAPKPVRSWTGVRDASKPCSACPQLPVAYANTASENEDCLYLNITTPADRTTTERRPVMVWIHGDGAVGSGDLFDPAEMVKTGNVVVVTINYRLTVFGGFGFPGLANSGTFGLLDQQEALRWVKQNIAAFGGDPDNVTLFGVSYGALSAGLQMLSPSARGLFHKVILQSGFLLMDLPAGAVFPGVEAMDWFGLRKTSELQEIGLEIARQLGVSSLDALKEMSVKDLLKISQVFQVFAIENKVVPLAPEAALRQGKFNKVPVLAGNTADEHRTFVGLFRLMAGSPVTRQQYPILLDSAFGKKARLVEQQYPLEKFETPAVALATVFTDYMWARSTFRQHELLSQYVPVYAYEFNDKNAPATIPFPKEMPSGAFHNAEVEYLFITPEFQSKLSVEQQLLSKKMIRYWTNFARTGNPAIADEWKIFNDKDRVPFVLSLDPKGSGSVNYEKIHSLEFWKKISN